MGKLLQDIEGNLFSTYTTMIDTSLGEITSLYRDGDLGFESEVLNHKELLTWGVSKQSKFIESIFVKFPIPPIVVWENPDKRYEVVDGSQRLLTYFHFTGKLLDCDDKLKLKGCPIVTGLNGKTIDDISGYLRINMWMHHIKMYVIKGTVGTRDAYKFKRL